MKTVSPPSFPNREWMEMFYLYHHYHSHRVQCFTADSSDANEQAVALWVEQQNQHRVYSPLPGRTCWRLDKLTNVAVALCSEELLKKLLYLQLSCVVC